MGSSGEEERANQGAMIGKQQPTGVTPVRQSCSAGRANDLNGSRVSSFTGQALVYTKRMRACAYCNAVRFLLYL